MEMRALSDIVEIQQLLAAYVFAIDAKDFDALDRVFTPDATFDYSVTGGETGDYAKIKPWLKKALAPFPVTQHLIGLPLIRLNGDTATARTMLFNPMQLGRPGGDHLFFVGATYVDDLVRTPEGWRIARRAEADPWVKDPPVNFTPETAA
ncbi:MAG: nuclear transport factor 2 family protein [Proteobacteria bacterium]|nr:nuclear transport factor 2 family protein [Pseudomonadota bacterium]